jgi:hypothetical protein
MIDFVRLTLLFWRTYLLRVLFTKRSAIVLLGSAIPPTIAWLVLEIGRRPPTPIEAFVMPSWILVLQLLVPLASVIAGSAVISEEVDDRTITYLLTRPIPRPSILIGRWLATVTILLLFVSASVGALGFVVEREAATYVAPEEEVRTFRRRDGEEVQRTIPAPDAALVAATEGGRLPEGLWRDVLAIALIGATVYSALFAAIGTFNRHPMIVGLGYAGAIEGFLANLPGTSQHWTIQYHMRSYLVGRHEALLKSIPEIVLTKFDTPAEAVTKLAAVLVVALAVGSIVISRKQYVLSA